MARKQYFRHMAQKKNSKKPMLGTWQEQFEAPGLEAIRAVQRSIDQMRPAGIDSYIDATQRMKELFPPVDYGAAKYNLVNIPDMSFFREFHAADDNLKKIVARLKRWSSLDTELDYEDKDDLEATEFELLPAPELIVPEQKIVLVREVTRIEKVIANIYKDHRELHHIHHREFEEMMAELLRSRGFDVHLTKQTRDGGTDIIALQEIAGSPVKFLVECKKQAPHRKVGIDIVRGFSHVINTQQANKGIIFTTSYFTADARKEQQIYMPYLLDLKDQNDVLNWVKRYVE